MRGQSQSQGGGQKVTPEVKDMVLNWLCGNFLFDRSIGVSPKTLPTVSFDNLNAILSQFQRMGLIEGLNSRRDIVHLVLFLEANDLQQRGGFVILEGQLKSNVQKLLLEIQVLEGQLQPNKLESVNKITSIAAMIAQALNSML